MPFLVHIFDGGKRKRVVDVDEGDVVLLSSAVKKTRRHNGSSTSSITSTSSTSITSTSASSSTACHKNHTGQDAGREGEGGRFNLLQGAVKDGAINPRNRNDPGKVNGTCSFVDNVPLGNTSRTNSHASPIVTNASIPSRSQSFHSKNTTFEERCNQLLRFKEEFGHCIVPNYYSDNPSLGHWYNAMRCAHNRIKKGSKTDRNLSPSKTDRNLSPDRIERLEDFFFKWHVHDASFEKRCHELVAFKKEFGHCNVPRSYKGNPSLRNWCNIMRNAYSKKQKGNKIRSNLSQDRIERLEEIGFEW